jgi:pSer/pThr/pTyr-binding forkhead associated (FHA) protein
LPPEVALLLVRVILALALYGFLGLLLIYLWRDSAGMGRHVEAPLLGRLDLLRGEEVSESFPLGEVNTVGRAVSNTIRLADSAVSAYHAQIHFSEGDWWLEDVGSSNGTVLNGTAIEARVLLAEGDQIQIGNARLLMHISRPASSSREGDPSSDGQQMTTNGP